MAGFLSWESYLPSESQLSPNIARQIFSMYRPPQVNLLASAMDRQLPVYYTKHIDPAGLTTDAL